MRSRRCSAPEAEGVPIERGEVTWEGEVEQTIEGGERITLKKQVVELGGDAPLCMVRKHAVGGPTRPPVMLVHGFAQNRYSWHLSGRSVTAWLAAQGWDTWNLELRGHGRSRKPDADRTGTVPGAESFADYLDDVNRAHAAIPGRAFWVGHSLGGAALYGAATQACAPGSPEASRPRGVIGLGAMYNFGGHNWLIKLMCGITHSLRDTELMQNLQVRTRMAGHLLSKGYGISDIAGYTFPISGWWPGTFEPELLEERLVRGFDWTSVKVWQEMSRWSAEGRFDLDEDWAHTDVPLMVVLGDKDHLIPPGDGRGAYDRSGSSDRTLLILDDYNHETHWGHLDIILGKLATTHVWPAIHSWMADR
jgi:pimeloyl-ACP methyl ester carboxylesterase